jgi:hypothetical protein
VKNKNARLEQGPFHVKIPDCHVKNSDVHVKYSDIRVKDADVHVKDSDIHVKNSDVHVKDSDVHVKNSDFHVKYSNVHVKNPDVHVKDADIRGKNSDLSVKDLERHVWKSEFHVTHAKTHTKPPGNGLPQSFFAFCLFTFYFAPRLHFRGDFDTKRIEGRSQRSAGHIGDDDQYRTLNIVGFGYDLVVVVEEVKGLSQIECVFGQDRGFVLGGRLSDCFIEPRGEHGH